MTLYLGVDGGGSKTAFALIDHAGGVLARAHTATSYYFSEGLEAVERTLAEGVDEVCRAAGITAADVAAAFFGLPGYGESSTDLPLLDALPGRILGHDRYSCDNDMVCGWAGSLLGEDGINVIAGTGSMTYGERAGVGHRVGGWGELFGDEGSAYWIAVRGLNAFSRMSDGRAAPGPLADLLRERLALGSDLDAVSLVIEQWGGSRSAIADLARTVCAAAAAGDAAASAILDEATEELAILVDATRTLIGFGDGDPVPVSYSGGMFGADGFEGRFRAALRRRPAKYDLRRPVLDPALGAAIYAAKRSGHPLDAEALAALAVPEER
ncbi:N-acetylglucosamine kinase [Mycolicibacterium grossiae]|uniref:N-acetylglucosamine kinase n=1 Tax=Mycolicibacterium grossiae TaxID=1552759 RepID=A0A1E8Q4G2_9MYCO|nr:BadF/BadG/BcrA/BcrD ATPase family protein [Mycolicibacterium grossiae]OFJ53472.1 N-acetylglucosamine kinase [Mycolicibacterium grossiae]QEM44043.1 N-acetylglucosamine kinase [Mycolicibacterium grossiae]